MTKEVPKRSQELNVAKMIVVPLGLDLRNLWAKGDKRGKFLPSRAPCTDERTP